MNDEITKKKNPRNKEKSEQSDDFGQTMYKRSVSFKQGEAAYTCSG